ncbi:MAG: FAD-binding oxidoreductase [Rhodobacteraceae bacterium]|nr:FAD-binding oxidoreductase [Paracoccaceae bacterium]
MSGVNPAYEIAVIGAGIAGASLAAELSASGVRTVLLEQEDQPGYHTTGRSAAVYSPIYGPSPIRALTRAALPFFNNPPQGFCTGPLLSRIDAAFVAREDQMEHLETMAREVADASTVSRVEGAALKERLPLLRDGYAMAALWDTGTSEIDVASLHHGYLRMFKTNGGVLKTRAPVMGLMWDGAVWIIETPHGSLTANIVVNAAGAWADELGQMAGAERIGLTPKRRTALMIDAPAGADLRGVPLTIDVEEQFYLKPDAGKLLISPANEDPEPPCDVQPDEMDIAICVDRIERAFEVSVKRVERPWAGLRSFVADKAPVVGFSQKAKGFYWLAGQGGYGIQSAPGIAQYAAAELRGEAVPAHIIAESLDPASIRPGRLGIGQ